MQQSAKKRNSNKIAEVFRKEDLDLVRACGEFYDDPYGFVLFCYPWGVPGTDLADEDGPDDWQREVMQEISNAIKTNGENAMMPIMYAISSGNGVGKTCLIAWLIHWFASTRDFSEIKVTSGKKDQLLGTTWRELAKWNRSAINGHHFNWTATKYTYILYPETWYAQAVTWSKNNVGAFQGTHDKHVLFVFDEASAIDDAIWEAGDGSMTTPGAMWLAFGNPNKAKGRFADCFGRFSKRWITRRVDSRSAKKANLALINAWIEDYGIDHDFVRVRVLGQFPKCGDSQFISEDDCHAAKVRSVEGYDKFSKVLGVDIARHGEDESAFARVQGRKVFPLKYHRIPDLMALAAMVAEEIDSFKPDHTFIDATGMGWGVYDRLRQLGYKHITAVQTGEKAFEPDKYVNKRVELWSKLRQFIQDGAQIPDDKKLIKGLTDIQYGFDGKGRWDLESKADMKKRGLDSPDGPDALALTQYGTVHVKAKDPIRAMLKRFQTKRGSSSMAA